MATRNSRRRSKNVIDLESSVDELELTSSSEEEVADAEEESDDSDGEEIDNDEEDEEDALLQAMESSQCGKSAGPLVGSAPLASSAVSRSGDVAAAAQLSFWRQNRVTLDRLEN